MSWRPPLANVFFFKGLGGSIIMVYNLVHNERPATISPVKKAAAAAESTLKEPAAASEPVYL